MSKVLDLPICFIDTETTGLMLDNDIIELAMIKVEPYTFKEIERWCIKVKPTRLDNATEEALRINQYSSEEWQTAINDNEAICLFLQKTKDCIIAGHNVTFDLSLIKRLVEKYKLTPEYHYKPLDTFPLAYVLGFSDLSNTGMSLSDISYQLGIKMVTEAQNGRSGRHTALHDAELTMKCFIEMVNRLM